jgi:predicted ArsR family transcriptional regulator
MSQNEEKILEFLKKQDWPVTTESIANELMISWQTAQMHLLKLLAEGKVKYKKVGRQNQWIIKNYK